MPSKRQCVEDVVRKAQQYIIDRKFISGEDLAKLIKEKKVTTEKIVAMIENFCFGPFDSGLLKEYVTKEAQASNILLSKKANQKIQQEDIDTAVVYLTQLIKIIRA